MPEFNVNLIALVVSIIAMQVLGFLWYGPLFGKLWLRGMGKSREELGNSGAAVGISITATIIAILALAWLIGASPAPDAATGALYGLIVAVAFIATSAITSAAYEGKSWIVTVLYILYNVAGLAMVGAILGAWR